MTGYARRVQKRSWHGVALLALVACTEDPEGKYAARDAGSEPGDAMSDVSRDDAADAHDASPGARLSETGLFEDMTTEQLAPGVAPYQPLYELWSDGAEKRRWVYLPPGARIDTSDMDHWRYPAGTKLWKEFVRDGVRVETRLLHKRGSEPSSWFMMAYHWTADQSDAVALPRGAKDVSGTPHDVPSETDCATCHENVPDRVLGLSAIQLSHALPGVTLASLTADGRLTSAPTAAGYPVPGDETARRALGYLHANCGNCHNPTGSVFSRVCLDLWLSTTALASVEVTSIYASSHGVRVSSQSAPSGVDCRLNGQSLVNSSLYTRMNTRGPETQMPPLASERIDDAGLASVAAWIGQLAAAGSCTADCDAPRDAGMR